MLVKSMDAVTTQNTIERVPVTVPVRLRVIKIAANTSLTALSMVPTLRFIISFLMKLLFKNEFKTMKFLNEEFKTIIPYSD